MKRLTLPKPLPSYKNEGHGLILFKNDCLKVMPALADASIDFVLTDPPYGIDFNNGSDLTSNREAILRIDKKHLCLKKRPITNDGPEEAERLFDDSLPHWKRLLIPGGCVGVCCSGGGSEKNIKYAEWSIKLNKPFAFKQMVIWDKGPMGIGWHYRRSYEVVLVAQKRGGQCKWHDESGKIENIIRPGNGIVKIRPKPHEHATAKPYKLAEHFIKLHTKEGDTVFDPFAGTGWVALACLNLKRKFIGIEIDDYYFGEMVKRVENWTKKKSMSVFQ